MKIPQQKSRAEQVVPCENGVLPHCLEEEGVTVLVVLPLWIRSQGWELGGHDETSAL